MIITKTACLFQLMLQILHLQPLINLTRNQIKRWIQPTKVKELLHKAKLEYRVYFLITFPADMNKG